MNRQSRLPDGAFTFQPHSKADTSLESGDNGDPLLSLSEGRRIQSLASDSAKLAEDARFLVSLGPDRFFARTPDGDLLRHAGQHILINISTIADKLPESFKSQCDQIPWDAIRGLRNRVAHEYDNIDTDIVWQTLTTDVDAFSNTIALEAQRIASL